MSTHSKAQATNMKIECKFCQSKGIIQKRDNKSTDLFTWYIECTNQKCQHRWTLDVGFGHTIKEPNSFDTIIEEFENVKSKLLTLPAHVRKDILSSLHI